MEALSDGVFDLAVVGGGIYGVCVARDAALRGLSVALVERSDFGAATSFNSLKIIHGGFRYLQSADLPRLRESVRERRYWLWAAPHLVRPLRFVIPLGAGLTRSGAAFRAALTVYRLLAVDGNRGLRGDRSLPAGGLIGGDACREQVPGLSDPPRGGVTWFDAQVVDTERLLLECLQQASEAGAVACNHVKALRLIEQGGSVHGIVCEDAVSGKSMEVRARVTVDATGPYRLDARPRDNDRGLVKSMNLVLAGSEAAHAFGAEIPDTGRMVFVTPWRGCSIVGTSHVGYSGDPDLWHCSSEDAAELMDELRAALPSLDLATDRILWRQGGLLPAAGAATDRSAVPAARAELVDHARSDGRDGLISVLGEKYTTARSLAERVVNLSLHKLRQRPRPCAVLKTPLPGTGDGMAGRDLEEPVSGAHARDRWRVAVREEMAVTLEDLVFRRCDRAVRGRMALDELEEAADVMADELRWSSQRRLEEVASVRRFAARHGGSLATTQWPESNSELTRVHIRRAV